MDAACYAPLDEALERLAASGPELRSGLTSHAPMTAEALCALGRPDAVAPWLASYRDGLLPAPPAREPIERRGWREALGRPERYADWHAFFAEELRGDAWPSVLDRWVARLARGLCADATHGVIRTGHAVRSLGVAESEPRLVELAGALASWAAGYQELPVPPAGAPAAADPRPPRDAIREVALQPARERRFAGTIVSALEALHGSPAFAPAVHLADLRGDPLRRAAELGEVFAQVYLANARDPLTTIVFVHGVTSAAALRRLLPHLGEETARDALRFAWQAGCALYAAFGSRLPAPGAPAPSAEDAASLAGRAVAHGDEHAIKLTEACLELDACAPSPVYRAVAQHALGALSRPHAAGVAAPR